MHRALQGGVGALRPTGRGDRRGGRAGPYSRAPAGHAPTTTEAVHQVSFLDYLSNPATQRTLIDQTTQHLTLVVVPMVFALIASLILGITAHRYPITRNAILTTVSWFLTIPSLALFALFLPIVGIGDPPVMIALFLYALLPIVRNTVAGLGSVDPAIVEAAKGMGMGPGTRLLRVELPTAWPVILAGVRVSTLLVVGIAAIAAIVGGNGLGQEIYRGINRIGSAGALEAVLGGTLCIVLLAIAFDLLYLGLGRLTIPRGLRD
jgi:osmoprotectant transport system permease protein